MHLTKRHVICLSSLSSAINTGTCFYVNHTAQAWAADSDLRMRTCDICLDQCDLTTRPNTMSA